MRVLLLQAAIAACLLLPQPQAMAKEQVGQVTLAKTALTGDGQPLSTKAPVHRDERIRTSANGLGEFLFRDGTKFAVGWNSSVVIDKFVFDDTAVGQESDGEGGQGQLSLDQRTFQILGLQDRDPFGHPRDSRHHRGLLCRPGRNDRRGAS